MIGLKESPFSIGSMVIFIMMYCYVQHAQILFYQDTRKNRLGHNMSTRAHYVLADTAPRMLPPQY